MKKILLIEDDPKLAESLKTAFEKENFEFLSAFDGEKGLIKTKEEKPDIILLDLILPKKDGFEVLKELKDNVETASVPVIVLTNLEGGGDVEKAFSLGAETYLVKANYSLEEILLKVKKTLGL